ncbi:MAG TPA: D-alanine--D-alanine ligase family protein [Phototrophicaceae bacterium]|nr:D-alanine--D-alanine ligase family protein [Phototrophicaceae bacterium]
MSAKRKTVVGVIFGGRSVEHDVSIVTGHQVMRAFDPERYEVVPIYINRDGRWFTGAPLWELKNFKDDEVTSYKGVESAVISPSVEHHGLIVNPTAGRFEKSEIVRLDVVFPAIHGTHGEDGTLQGLFELADLPYVGCGVLGSAIGNDKMMSKVVLSQQGVPIVEGVAFSRAEWEQAPDQVIQHIVHELPEYPLFIKPATLGSSIGIGRAGDETMLRAYVDVAANLDRLILVEKAVTGGVEINCAVMGNGLEIRASVLEQPVSWEEFLTYEEKYLRGGDGMKSAERLIPAPLSAELTERIKNTAIQAFRAVQGRGTARIDFLVKPENDEIYVNELNTMPGSLAFYLWQEEGLSQRQMVDRLVELAREAHAEKRRNTYNYQTNLLEVAAARGLKGIKSAKNRISSGT